MPKTITTPGKTALAAEVTRMCLALKITRRDGDIFYFTDHDADLTIGGHIYASSVGWTRMAITRDSHMAVDNSTLVAMIDDAFITVDDMRAGKFDSCEVQIYAVLDWADLSLGTLDLGKTTSGEVIVTPSGLFTTEVRGLLQRLQNNVSEVYTPWCRADLGDTRCKIPTLPSLVQRSHAYVKATATAYGDTVRVVLTGDGDSRKYSNVYFECTTGGTTASSAPTFDATVGNTTADGSVVWTCRDAWTRSAVVASVTDSGTFAITVSDARAVDGWFDKGVVIWETGNNSGRDRDIKTWTNSGGIVTLMTPMDEVIQVGDRMAIVAGCDKKSATCKTKFGNLVNFRGFPDVPGTDALLQSASVFA